MYRNTRWLVKHEEQHEQKIKKTESKSKSSFKCSCCKIGFETRDECKAHQQTAHADTLSKCFTHNILILIVKIVL